MGHEDATTGGVADTAADAAADGADEVWGDAEFVSTGDIERIHVKQGYVDGLSRAKEDSLQRGFDDGYPTGAQYGIRAGQVLARLAPDDPRLAEARRELNIANLLQRAYFDANLNADDHPVLAKWEAE
ncbi:Protein YAE1 [[Candida] zeylanoides]|jgi:hypothetical protein